MAVLLDCSGQENILLITGELCFWYFSPRIYPGMRERMFDYCLSILQMSSHLIRNYDCFSSSYLFYLHYFFHMALRLEIK